MVTHSVEKLLIVEAIKLINYLYCYLHWCYQGSTPVQIEYLYFYLAVLSFDQNVVYFMENGKLV